MSELPKAYEAKEHEDKIYALWEEREVFNPDCHLEQCHPEPVEGSPANAGTLAKQEYSGSRTKREPFSIAMPPPNVTGQLHMGHAVMLALEDIMIRFERMRGKKTLWIPGLDHAAIATQNVVERKLKKEQRVSRHDLGREKFLKEVEAFAEQSKATIRNQVKKMGASCDWSRERYTLEPALVEAVQRVFMMMHDDGLIYRGDRIVNWCPRCASTLADDEVEHEEKTATLYTFRYDKDFPEDLAISTVRPETKLGDTAVAVHPDDPRAKKYKGKTFTVDLGVGPQEIRVIADGSIDREFGTGVLGVTPAHSVADAEMAERHKLPSKSVIGEDGRIRDGFGVYSGLMVKDAREKLVAHLREQGLLIEEKEITHNLSVCYRCNTAVEPLISKQWFIDVNKKAKRLGNKSIKESAHNAVASGDITIIPDRFNKIYFHWIDNLRDWCISRQIWFGHRIPAWFKGDEVKVQIGSPGKGWMQDPDVLDTWFSAALWTFSTLGWPKETLDLKTFHPTSVMETGYDILFFWVARMVMMTSYVMQEIPFRTVYLHGLVRDRQGRKMSKSHPETCLDPLDMIAKYGADATRLSLFVGTTPGQDARLYEEKIAGYQKFVNKLWNIARFTFMNVKEPRHIAKRPKGKTLADRWILSSFDQLAFSTTENLAAFNFSAAAEELYEWTWHTFADWYLEIAKFEREHAYSDDKEEILLFVLDRLLVLWHPFCPFVTETLYRQFGSEKTLMVEAWYVGSKKEDEEAAHALAKVQEWVTQIRAVRVEKNIKTSDVQHITVTVAPEDAPLVEQVEVQNLITGLARCHVVKLQVGEGVSVILEAAGR